VPDLAAIPKSRRVAVTLHNPQGLSQARDGAILVAERFVQVQLGRPRRSYQDNQGFGEQPTVYCAQQITLDGSAPARLLPASTARSTHVLPVDGDERNGLIIVSCDEGRVERIGATAWRRMDLSQPYSAVVVGNLVLVTESGAGRVARLDLDTGEAHGTFGEGTLRKPTGIAALATGEIAVASQAAGAIHAFGAGFHHEVPGAIHVFDHEGKLLRTLSHGKRSPSVLGVDGQNRLYVANSNAIAVVDPADGTQLATISVGGNAQGVLVTRLGDIVVSVTNGSGQVNGGWLEMFGVEDVPVCEGAAP
jgi:hypothetical protein